MTLPELLGASWLTLGAAAIAATVCLIAIIALTRTWGLRSFSKMSAFDFVATVAVGSVLGATAVTSASLSTGVVAAASLFAAQAVIAKFRRLEWVRQKLDNQPVLLMDHTEILHDNLRRTDTTVDDVRGKLREANVIRMDQVRYVVFEPTGDISVLHVDSDEDRGVDDFLLEGVDR